MFSSAFSPLNPVSFVIGPEYQSTQCYTICDWPSISVHLTLYHLCLVQYSVHSTLYHLCLVRHSVHSTLYHLCLVRHSVHSTPYPCDWSRISVHSILYQLWLAQHFSPLNPVSFVIGPPAFFFTVVFLLIGKETLIFLLIRMEALILHLECCSSRYARAGMKIYAFSDWLL